MSTLLTGFSLFLTTPIYESETTVEVMQFDENGSKVYGDTNFILNQIALLKSEALAEYVIKTLNLISDPNFVKGNWDDPGVSQEEKVAEALAKFNDDLMVTLVPDSSIIKLRFEHPDAKKAADISNRLTHIFYSSDLLKTAKISFDQATRDFEYFSKNLEANYDDQRGVETPSIALEEYIFLKNQLESKRLNYEFIGQHLNGNAFSTGSSSNFVKIVDEAKPARLPFKPDITRTISLSIILGLGLGTAIASFIMHMDERIKGPEDIKSKFDKFLVSKAPIIQSGNQIGDARNPLLFDAVSNSSPGIPLLGVIPCIRDDNIIDVLRDPQSTAAEAYASLRTNLQYSSNDGGPRIIQVTSSAAGEGKSVTALGLALSFAASEKRVLIIDADLRRPSLITNTDSIGLSGLLTSDQNIEKHIVSTKVENMDAVSSGVYVPNPTALLNSLRFDEIITYAREHYEYVIVDSPPVLGLADAPIIGAKVDTTVFVIMSNRITTNNIKAAMERLQFSGSRLIGITLTRYKAENRGHSNYYKYSYDSSYSYDKQSKNKEKQKFNLS